ncbi:Uncharacterized protein T10_12704, partial [Trichinella papuae]
MHTDRSDKGHHCKSDTYCKVHCFLNGASCVGQTMSERPSAVEENSDHESESSGEHYCTICEPLIVKCESDSCNSDSEYPNTRHMARNDYSEITDLAPYFSRHVKALDIYTAFEDIELYNYLFEFGLIESSLSVLRLMVRDHYLASEPLIFRQVWPEVDPDYPLFRKSGRQPVIVSNPVPPPPQQEISSSPESEQAETVQSDGCSPDESTQSPSVSESTVTSEPRPRVFQAMRVPIMVRDLPPRSSDSSIKDGLYHKFKKYGKVVEVKVDAQAALENAMNEVFFGKPLNAVLASSEMDVEDNEKRPLARDVDCYHPKSSRTLYVGNLDNRLREEDLTKHFNQFGEILDVDIKNRDTPAPFCFIQFADIVSVVNAILAMETDGIIGRNKVKVGFGKPVPTTMVWIDDLPTHVTEVYLRRKLGFYGCVIDVIIDAQMHQAVVVFDDVDAAQKAVQGMKGSKIYEARIQVDFCSREMYDLFIDRMHKAGLLKNSPSDSGLAESIGSRSTAKSNKRKSTTEVKHCSFKRERDQSLISNDSVLSPSSSDGRQTRANSECSSVGGGGGGSVKLETIFSGDSIAGKDRREKKIILNNLQLEIIPVNLFKQVGIPNVYDLLFCRLQHASIYCICDNFLFLSRST